MKRFLLLIFTLLLLLLAGLGFFYQCNPKNALLLVVPELGDLKQLSLKIKGETLRAEPAYFKE